MADSIFSPRVPRFENGYAPGLPATVRLGFTFDGKEYKPGKPFPYQALHVDTNTLRGLWMTDRIVFAPGRVVPL